jgi:hypothetical protein
MMVMAQNGCFANDDDGRVIPKMSSVMLLVLY